MCCGLERLYCTSASAASHLADARRAGLVRVGAMASGARGSERVPWERGTRNRIETMPSARAPLLLPLPLAIACTTSGGRHPRRVDNSLWRGGSMDAGGCEMVLHRRGFSLSVSMGRLGIRCGLSSSLQDVAHRDNIYCCPVRTTALENRTPCKESPWPSASCETQDSRPGCRRLACARRGSTAPRCTLSLRTLRLRERMCTTPATLQPSSAVHRPTQPPQY